MFNFLKKYKLPIIGIVLAVAVILPALPGKAAPLPAGNVRCYFYEPTNGSAYFFTNYPMPADFKGRFGVDVQGKNGDPIPVRQVTPKWTTVRDLGNYKWEFVGGGDGYTATFKSSGDSANDISPETKTVGISDQTTTRVGSNEVRLTVEIKKDGQTVSSCNVDATLAVRWYQPYQAPSPGNVSYPTSTLTYDVTTSKGTSTVSYKFTDTIKNITFGQNNWSVYIGNHFKNIFWMANRYGGGPAGRWNISDPWNPEQGEVLGLVSGGSALALGKAQPAEHRGPFSSGAWPHPPSMGYVGGVVADLPSSEGRFVYSAGESVDRSWAVQELRGVFPVISIAPGRGLQIGQMIDGKWQQMFENNAVAIDTTASGKFFFIMAGGSMGYGSGASAGMLQVFDVTNLTGSTDFPYLGPASSQPWPNVREVKVIEVEGVRNHFVIARSHTGTAAQKPRFYIGEIDADTGRILRSNSFLLDITSPVYTAPWSNGPNIFPGSNMEPVSVGRNTYIFMNESYTRNSYSPLDPGILKIAAYKFDAQKLEFTRKGDMTFTNYPGWPWAELPDSWKVARSERGDAYPMLMSIKTAQTKTYVNSYGETITQPNLFDLSLYSLKSFLDSSTVKSVTDPVVDITLPGEIVKRPFTMGMIITVNPDNNSFSDIDTNFPFIKVEGAKTYMYLYRKAVMFDGRQSGDPVMPYHEFPADPTDTHWGTNQNIGSSFRGVAAMRVDKMEVTSFAPKTGYTPTNPPGGGGGNNPPGNGGGGNPSTIGSGGNCYQRYPTNLQLRMVCEQIETIKAGVCAKNPALSFCK